MIPIVVTTKRDADPYWLKLDSVEIYNNEPNEGLIKPYHYMWQRFKTEDILTYIHDDVEIHDCFWETHIKAVFQDPRVAIVGLGGAPGIGDPDIYKTPYSIRQLARIGYGSNQTDWPAHGGNELGERRVAVVDGFFMAVSGYFLQMVKGWDWIQSNFHCYDLALCLEAHRLGMHVKTVGISCTHHGGGTSTTAEYDRWCAEHNTTPEQEHEQPHRWLYEEYRDVLPLVVQP